MIVKTATYKRVKNLGNYQSETLELSAEVEEDEEIHEAIYNLKQIVIDQLLGFKEEVDKIPDDF